VDPLEQAKQRFFEGRSLLLAGDFAGAERQLREALRLAPDRVSVLTNLSAVLLRMRKAAEARAHAERALALDPPNAEAWVNLAGAHALEYDYSAALECCDKAIALRPSDADACVARAQALHALGRYGEALAASDRASALRPDHVGAWVTRSKTLHALNRIDEALADSNQASALDPCCAAAWSCRGLALKELGRLEDAFASFQRALDLDPDSAEAWTNQALALLEAERHDEALASCERALALEPGLPYLLGDWLLMTLRVCRWDGFEPACAELGKRIEAGRRASPPFAVLATRLSPAVQKRCAETYALSQFHSEPYVARQPRAGAARRVHIGYFSSDLRDHAVSHALAEVFERHDRSRFEVTGFAFGPPAADAMRRRLQTAFERFIDVRAMHDAEVVSLARELEVDIAVDLNGYTRHSRTGIFAARAAPLQVGYLGYPGTMGAPFIDYLVADPTLVPPQQRSHYTERIVYLPASYLPIDTTQRTPERTLRREELGLPATGFVFCCFNNNYKITPGLFAAWMRVLRNVPGSVLWLFEDNTAAATRLKEEAQRAAVAPDRLVFARRVPLRADHLARYQFADLFLDTWHYNAHATAGDALWSGLPLITLPGASFASRVAASLLTALGLPELIASSDEQYERLAIAYATDPVMLAAVRRKLAEHRATHPAFDTAGFTRHLEAAYAVMWERHQAGLPREHIDVQALSRAR
jgi:predicted O-linked N-acetylglucosamine transferase (SPINDLY family)